MTNGRMLRAASVAVLAVAMIAIAARALSERQQEFPHQSHAGLFPLCEACHQGVPDGDRSTFYPPPATCNGCHDGTAQPRVTWQPPAAEPDNVVFEHPTHPDTTDGQLIECVTCHTAEGAPRMAVLQESLVPRCLACHAHEGTAHLLDTECSTCHMPLADAPFDRARLLALPAPADHDVAGFVATYHGTQADDGITRCAVCHTRERCEDCHVNAADVASIGAMPQATGIVARELPAYAANYPVPASHERPDFVLDHGDATVSTCATCHTQDDCMSCHVEPVPDAVNRMTPAHAAVARGARIMAVAPASHQRPEFLLKHSDAASLGTCSTCHVQDDCTTCHVQPLPAMLDRMTPARAGTVRRIQTARVAPPSHEAPLFVTRHGPEAATGARTCAVCHERTMCVDCHDAATAAEPTQHAGSPSAALLAARPGALSGPPGFHPANFMARHSAEAYGRRLECSSCHDQRLFCADCHESAGMSSARVSGRLGPGFHDAEPLWLLRHGQAARQGLESCASCHAQNECMQCHSVLGAFKVSPHGPDFDARRAQQRNPGICLVCHLTDPLRGRTE